MRKKLMLLLCLLVLCTQLTGCGLESLPIVGSVMKQAEDICDGAQTSALKDTVANDNLFSMSKSTKDAQTKALKAADSAATLSDKYANANWPWTKAWYGWRSNSASVKANNALNKYESAKSTDDTWLTARAEAGKTGVNGTFQWSKFGWLIGFALVILLFVILTLLRNSKRRSKAALKAAKKADTVVIQQPAPAPAVPTTTQPALAGRSEDKSVKQCKKYCEKYEIDYDTMLAQYGGDPQKLLDVLISSRKEDFHPE